MPNGAYHEIDGFVRNRFASVMHTLRGDRDGQRLAVGVDLVARGVALNPLDTHFDDGEVYYCNAVLKAKASALLEAYDVYGQSPDDHLWQELSRHHSELVAASKDSLRGAAAMRAFRKAENALTDVARAEALGQKIERSTHATMKALACEIEGRRQMPRTDNGQ